MEKGALTEPSPWGRRQKKGAGARHICGTYWETVLFPRKRIGIHIGDGENERRERSAGEKIPLAEDLLLALIVKSTGDAIILLDRFGQNMYANSAAGMLCNLSPDKIRARYLGEIIDTVHAGEFDEDDLRLFCLIAASSATSTANAGSIHNRRSSRRNCGSPARAVGILP